MSNKRRSSTLTGSTDKKSRSNQHHHAQSNRAQQHGGGGGGGYEIKARVDPMTGQQNAFPDLEASGNAAGSDALFYGPAEDGMAYLRMVRAEAAGVPSMLLAPSQQNNHSISSIETSSLSKHSNLKQQAFDSAAFWDGEAVVAEPASEDEDDYYAEDDYGDEGEDYYQESCEPQDAFYESLLSRFTSLQSSLRQHASSSKDANQTNLKDSSRSGVDPSPTVSLTASQNAWYKAFSYSKPTTGFISKLSQSSTIVALERLDLLLTKRNVQNAQRRGNFGAWIWSLLAHCRALGQLTGEEVGALRSLAKNALKLERKLRASSTIPRGPAAPASADPDDPEDDDNEIDHMEEEKTEAVLIAAGVREDTGNDGEEVEEGELAEGDESGLAEARQRLLDMLSARNDVNEDIANETDEQLLSALMMLDSIVTIVGDVFGQRDLLEQRSAW